MKWPMKKKPYHVPELKVHGTVEDITKAFGNDVRFQDTLFFSSGSIRQSGIGSHDSSVESID